MLFQLCKNSNIMFYPFMKISVIVWLDENEWNNYMLYNEVKISLYN